HVPEHPRVPELPGPDLVHELWAMDVEPDVGVAGTRGGGYGVLAAPALSRQRASSRSRRGDSPRLRGQSGRGAGLAKRLLSRRKGLSSKYQERTAAIVVSVNPTPATSPRRAHLFSIPPSSGSARSRAARLIPR